MARAGLCLAASPGPSRADFHEWAAVVVAGDDHAAHAADPTEAFDNARRDVVRAARQTRGFAAGHMAQFSVEPRQGGRAGERAVTIFDRLGDAGRRSARRPAASSISAPTARRTACIVGKTYLTPAILARRGRR